MAPPEFQKLETTQAGQRSLIKWLQIAGITAPIGYNANWLQPSQEMAPYQRRIRYLLFPTAVVVGAGVSVNFNADVPEGETWKVKEVQVSHTDPGGSKTFQISTFTPGPIPNIVSVKHPVVAGGVPVSLFPGRVTLPAAASSEHYDRPSKVIELYGRDALIIGPQGTSTGASVIDCTVKIEIVPQLLLRTRVNGNTSVV